MTLMMHDARSFRAFGAGAYPNDANDVVPFVQFGQAPTQMMLMMLIPFGPFGQAPTQMMLLMLIPFGPFGQAPAQIP